MDNCYRKPGLRLPRWIAAAVGVWMIWMIIPLVEPSAGSCPDASGVDMPCPLNELAGVNCTYIKGIPAELPELRRGKTNFPGSVKELTVQPYLKNDYRTDDFITYLNITWKIDASGCRNLRGFLLNVTFLHGGIQRYILRTYKLAVENWNNQNIFETAFRHECIIPSLSSLYRIEVHSLPLSTNNRKNVAVIYYRHEATPTADRNNPVSTFDWIATMWMTRRSSEDGLSGVDVCFFFAPTSFGFERYRMSLMHVKPSVLMLALQTVFIYDNGTQKRHECVTFGNVSPGIYKVYLMPLAEEGSCTCRTGPDNCMDTCMASVFEPIDMTESVGRSPVSFPPTATITTTTTLPPDPDATTDSNLVEPAGIVVAATGAGVVVIISAVVVFIILALLCRRRDKVSFGPFGTHSTVVPILTPEKQPSA